MCFHHHNAFWRDILTGKKKWQRRPHTAQRQPEDTQKEKKHQKKRRHEDKSHTKKKDGAPKRKQPNKEHPFSVLPILE